ncbi:MAG: sensor histidine kinase [Sphingomonas bacterium]|nr:PAS domain S-box protein [Sphingomonas bacterium]MDB5688255.1 sensor histidine kinase [Sphingomonas bacterium]
MKLGSFSERALILAPSGRDASVAVEILARIDVSSTICSGLEDLIDEIASGAGFAIISEEALRNRDLGALERWIAGQQPWSDFAFIVLTFRTAAVDSPSAARLIDTLGNVSFVERPFHPSSLSSLARSAVRARRRQYEARGRIEELHVGQERLRFAQIAGAIGTFELLPHEALINVSEEFCALWGIPARPSFPLEEVMQILLPEDRHRITTDSRELPAGALNYIEYRIRRPDTGEIRWIARRGEPVMDARRGTHRFFGVTYDITDRKRNEQALIESRDRLASESAALELLNRTSMHISMELNLDKLVQRVVETGTELIGAEVGAFFYNVRDDGGEAYMLYALAGAPREAFADFPMPRNTALFAPTFAGEGAVRSDDITRDPRYGRSDTHFGMPRNHLKVTSYLAVPVISRSGKVLGGLLFGHSEASRFDDRSERLVTGLSAQAAVAIDNATLFDSVQAANATLEARVEERTRERDRMWRLSTDLMDVCAADGQLVAVNRAWTQLLGWKEEELVGANLLDLVHPDDAAVTAETLSPRNEGAPVVRTEMRLRARDGDYRHISRTASPEGGLFYAIGRDVTEQREIEEQLRQSQKMEAVGQLTGGIAHDFNNLLQGITGSLDIIQRRIAQGRTADIDRFITGAATSANRAAALTHRLLAFSRRQPLDPKPVRANPLVSSMEDLLRRTLGEQVSLELVLAGGLWLTLCDPNQLENAILNLCINARDAMPNGGQLTIETCNAHLDSRYAARTRDVRPGQYVCICVSDTGSGMPPEVVSRAFDPFFTTKPLGQGTGLGLSMIYGFARQSEGYVKIYSEIDKGTTVKLYLPRHRGEEQVETDAPAGSAPAAGAGETVLLVEDDVVVRGLILETLAELGYDALEAGDGPSGIRILESDARVDLLVTDIGLPGLNGRQVADRGRELRPGLKVLFMTGYAENAALASGFLDHGMEMITKPFPMDLLAQRLRDIMEGRSAGFDREAR